MYFRSTSQAFLCQAVAWREVSECHFHCKESLGEKARVLAVAVRLQAIMECYKSTFFSSGSIHMLPFGMYCRQCRHLLSYGKGAYGFSRAVKFRPSVLQKIFLFPLRESVFVRKKPDSPKPCILIADETKVTDLTVYAYKKSQHDEKR